MQILQKINAKVGATNEQTNENKVQGKNKTKSIQPYSQLIIIII